MPRIQKIIANSGYCSRRKAEELISAGKVLVNGKKASIGQSATEEDSIFVDGRPLRKQEKRYYILNKPKGYETTMKSTRGLPIVASLVKSNVRVVPAGRLDSDSRGLLIMTNDGELCHRIMHPRFTVDKVYEVTINTAIPEEKINVLRKGVVLDDKTKTRPCKVEVNLSAKTLTILRMTLHEGKKRQIRRMLTAVGFGISDLVRIQIGNLSLNNLKEGSFRELTDLEVSRLKKILGM
ncbi:MAG: rRNA pseudouridine synthase [Nanoarchaeota archaeon]|nr:MAG: rRNA pseudouridine synthase [Nanoarchaeota archaeon]